ncbi:hypothetical protein AmDm5_2526 [Acetobacter malorum]|nr:hypothetical protein AmDm5_2526 [Acetobacter malorum]
MILGDEVMIRIPIVHAGLMPWCGGLASFSQYGVWHSCRMSE